ncbi:MAG TPA: Flp family type IVb pilin [Magnetospirillum sp.]|nr:Flp family type IVb pilin [Magnetospirillum sp.]
MKISLFRRFSRNESGATALEYGLLAGLISVMVIAGATLAGTSLNTLFTGVGNHLKSAATNAGTAGGTGGTQTPAP